MTDIAERAALGLPLHDVTVIDGHCHIGLYPNFYMHFSDAAGLIKSMDATGTDIACISAMASIGPDYRYGNDIVMDALSGYPDRFIGYAVVNPNYEDDMAAELERCFSCKGMKAIKLHPSFHGCTPDFGSYHKVYELADQLHLTVLIHTWGRSDVASVDKLAGQYQGANFIIGHSGAEILAMADTIDTVNRRPNAYADLALSLVYEGNVEWFTANMGSSKIIFGTDAPLFDPRPNFGRVAMARISDSEKRDILGLNMKRLLGI